jgi:hypothetical protein
VAKVFGIRAFSRVSRSGRKKLRNKSKCSRARCRVVSKRVVVPFANGNILHLEKIEDEEGMGGSDEWSDD